MADLYVILVILGGLTVAMFLGSLWCSYHVNRVLSEAAERDERRFSEWGWRPGQGHSVLLLGDGKFGGFKVADPMPGYGIEMWSSRNLEELFSRHRRAAYRTILTVFTGPPIVSVRPFVATTTNSLSAQDSAI